MTECGERPGAGSVDCHSVGFGERRSIAGAACAEGQPWWLWRKRNGERLKAARCERAIPITPSLVSVSLSREQQILPIVSKCSNSERLLVTGLLLVPKLFQAVALTFTKDLEARMG